MSDSDPLPRSFLEKFPMSPSVTDKLANAQQLIADILLRVPSQPLRESLIAAVLKEARENGADSPVDYGGAEQLTNAMLQALQMFVLTEIRKAQP